MFVGFSYYNTLETRKHLSTNDIMGVLMCNCMQQVVSKVAIFITYLACLRGKRLRSYILERLGKLH